MDDFEVLTKTLYFEAGSTQEISDILMVAWVIRNRVKGKKWYGNTYQKVCLKKWQFSCWNGWTLKRIEAIKWDNGKDFRWSMCRFIAAYVMEAPVSHNPFPKCCYYFNPSLCRPTWASKFNRVHPNLKLDHVFYTDPKD